MRPTLASFLLLFVLTLAGCSCAPGVAAVGAMPVAAPPCLTAAPPAAPPCFAAAPPPVAAPPCAPAAQTLTYAYSQPYIAANGVQYVQVQYRVGASEWARATLAVPGGVVVCVSQWLADVGIATGKALTCIGTNLVPTPTPSASYVAAPAPQYAPPAATPCAPPGVPTPSAPPPGKWLWVPGEPPTAPAVSSHVERPSECCCGDRCGIHPDLDLMATATR